MAVEGAVISATVSNPALEAQLQEQAKIIEALRKQHGMHPMQPSQAPNTENLVYAPFVAHTKAQAEILRRNGFHQEAYRLETGKELEKGMWNSIKGTWSSSPTLGTLVIVGSIVLAGVALWVFRDKLGAMFLGTNQQDLPKLRRVA